MSKTVAELVVERLIAWNVEVIFGFPGDGVNGLFGALRTHKDKIRFIQVRHEEAAAFAARRDMPNSPAAWVSVSQHRDLVEFTF